MGKDELNLLANRVACAGACLQSSSERVNTAETLLEQALLDMYRDRKILLDARRDLDRLLIPLNTCPDAKTRGSAPSEWGVGPETAVAPMPMPAPAWGNR